MKNEYYILKNKEVTEVPMMEWAMWLEENRKERIVGKDKIGKKTVSTVFIGLDHNFLGNGLHLFETMIFPGGELFSRCATWKQAEKEHQKAIESLK